jgi:hydroxymethylbilane synthase
VHAVLERATWTFWCTKEILIFLMWRYTATGSLRRQAQWLNKYPNHKVVDLRGNVNTRMQNCTKAIGGAVLRQDWKEST